MRRDARIGLCGALALLLAACQPMPTRPPAPEPAIASHAPHEKAAPVAPLEPETAQVEPEPDYRMPELPEIRGGAELFARLRDRLVLPPCAGIDAREQRWIDIHTRRPERFANELRNALPLMALTLEEIERLWLPGEFALIPIIESGYRPDARGAGNHVGLWQFGEPTARLRGLKVSANYDGRMSPFSATRAALSYLAHLQNDPSLDFIDPRRALIAYNAGPYRIRKLIDAAAARSPEGAVPLIPAGVPNTSIDYLARLSALACIVAEPARFGLELPTDAVVDPLRTTTLPRGASSLGAIAKQLDLDVKPLARLNPAFRHGYIANDAPRELLVPESQLAAFASLDTLPHAPMPALSNTASVHVVKKGETLSAIARRHRIKLSELMAINGLGPHSILRIGQRLKLTP